MSKFKDRILQYEGTSNFKFLTRVPLIIKINGRSFSKVTSLLDKPFSVEFAQCMYASLAKIVQEVDGTVFGYCFNDEMILITRNDQNQETESWYNNDIKKIVSATSSLITLEFNNQASAIDMNLMGESIFLVDAFTVPNISEAINVLVLKQQQAFQSAVHNACFFELIKKHNKNEIKELLSGLSNDEKINLLEQDCGIIFDDYKTAFKRGIGCYRAPTIVSTLNNSETIKNKWQLNLELPIFTKDHLFLNNILK